MDENIPSDDQQDPLIKKTKSNLNPSIAYNLITNIYMRDGSKNLEQIYINRKNKSAEGTKIQKENMFKWFNEDKKLLNVQYVMRDLDKFVSADLEVVNINNDRFVKGSVEWSRIQIGEGTDTRNISAEGNVLTNTITPKVLAQNNVILKNKILKLCSPELNLRSLSIEAEFTLLMSGESTFYIFSRGVDSFSKEMAICSIEKELDTSRKFISFSILESSELDDKLHFKTLKKQEIPKQENYIKTMDISEIKFLFCDNGDNKCYISIEHDNKKNLNFIADFYYPISERCNFMFGASGDLISIKSFTIKQVERKQNIFKDEQSRNTQSCNCCIIF